ncbi:MAG: acetyltransferase [Hyphomicrobiales bacterium]
MASHTSTIDTGRRLLLIGAGGHGKVAADIAEVCGFKDVTFLDQSYPERETNGSWKIIDDLTSIDNYKAEGCAFFLTVGDNRTRERLWKECKLQECVQLIHPSTNISRYATLNFGVLAVAGVIVNPDTVIGCGTILNTACTIDHDCVIGDFVHISPGANIAGGCRIGDRSWIGIGASIKQGVTIGSDVTVGAGATVVSDIPDGLTVIGTPAKPLKEQ